MKAVPLANPLFSSSTSRAARTLASRCGSEAAGPAMATRRSKLQLLYDLAQRTFAEHGQPTPAQVDVLKLALSSVPLAELGIQHSEECACAEESCPGRQMPASQGSCAEQQFDPDAHSGPRPGITYLHIHEDENLALGIFCLPANAQIPLHNHPGMTVMSRVLFGKMHVKSYDWARPGGGTGSNGGGHRSSSGSEEEGSGSEAPLHEARRVLDRVFNARDEPAVLFPNSGGNIHQFTAVTDCAVLDLLSPPYSTDKGRDCIYYQEVAPRSPPLRQQQPQQQQEKDAGLVLLAEYEPPAEFAIDSGVYKGLQIRKKPYLLRNILAAAAAAAAQVVPSASPAVSNSQQQQQQQWRPTSGDSSGDDTAEVSSSSAAGPAPGPGPGAAPSTGAAGGGNPAGPTQSGLQLEGAAAAGAAAAATGNAAAKSPPGKARRGGGGGKKVARRR